MAPPRRPGRLLRLAALLVAIALLVLALRAQGPQLRVALLRTGLAAPAAALALVLAGLFASALVWRGLLRDLGSPLPVRSVLHVFFVGQLGKYVPGSVFAIAAQMQLGRERGVPRSRVGAAGLLHMGVLVATGLLVAVAALPLTSPAALSRYWPVLLVLPVGLVLLAPPVLTPLVGLLLRVGRREPLDRPLSWRGVGTAGGWALAMWLAYGGHVLLLARAQPHGGSLLVPLSLGGYALAWSAGFLFLVAPAGAGVRELALVAVLAPALDRPAATVVAVLSRGLMTVGDLLWAGAATAVARPGRSS